MKRNYLAVAILCALSVSGCGGGGSSSSPESGREGNNQTENDTGNDGSTDSNSRADDDSQPAAPENPQTNPPETQTPDTPDSNPEPTQPETPVSDFTRTVPDCRVAASRIQDQVKSGDSASEVRRNVGKPYRVEAASFWSYSPKDGPSVVFDVEVRDKVLTPTNVHSHDSGVRDCDQAHANLVAAANDLLADTRNLDFSDDSPTCQDAATRILARVELGMNTDEVRRAVGKPASVFGAGYWQYAGYSGPTIYFETTFENGRLKPLKVISYNSGYESCP